MQEQLREAEQAAGKAQAAGTRQGQQLEEAQQDRDKARKSIGLRDTALKALRQEVDDVLREDAEKAASLEEVIEELERLQQSEADKTQQLKSSQLDLQVNCPCYAQLQYQATTVSMSLAVRFMQTIQKLLSQPYVHAHAFHNLLIAPDGA
jgi:chromosome segregation ATPase